METIPSIYKQVNDVLCLYQRMWISEENQAHSSPRRIYKEKEDDHSTATPASVSERTRDRPMCLCVWLILCAVRGSISARNPIEPMMMIADEAEERKKEKEETRGVLVSREWSRDSIHPIFFFFLRLRVCWMHLALMIQSDQSLSLTHSLSLSLFPLLCTISSSSHTQYCLVFSPSLVFYFYFLFVILFFSLFRRVILIASAISRIRLSGHPSTAAFQCDFIYIHPSC
jgi:hypothetical protein